MEKIEINHSGNAKKLLHYRTHEGHIQFEIETILYLHGTGAGPYTHIYIKEYRKYSVCETISSIEEILNEEYFCRCHNSWLVNLNKVEFYCSRKKFIVLNNTVRIPISKSRWPDTLKKLIAFQVPDKKEITKE